MVVNVCIVMFLTEDSGVIGAVSDDVQISTECGGPRYAANVAIQPKRLLQNSSDIPSAI